MFRQKELGENSMKRICSRCKIVMGFIGGADTNDQETHGTCLPCLEIEKEEIRKFWENIEDKSKILKYPPP